MKRYFVGSALCASIGLGAPLAKAQTSIFPGTEVAPGVFVTPMDNPRFSSTVTLQALESAERSSTDEWGFWRFELNLLTDCGLENPFCVPVPTRSTAGALNVWPDVVSVWDGTTNPLLTIEQHGLQLGSGPATVGLQRLERSGSLTPLATVTAQLDPETLVVPVNVIIIVPAPGVNDSLRSAMEPLANRVEYFQVLFDDLWLPNLVRTSDMGQIDFIGGFWDARSQPTVSYPDHELTVPSPPLTDVHIRPDDVWAQCGIQFRLASITAIEEPDPRKVNFTMDGTPLSDVICNSSFTGSAIIRGFLREWKDMAQAQPTRVFGDFNSSAITVPYSFRLQHPECAAGILPGVTSPSDRISGIATGESDVANNSLVLAHELGHSLGLDHPSGDGPCPGTENLMCGDPGYISPHIRGCEVRDGAPLATLPFNCVPLAGEPLAATCDQARASAGGVSSNSQVPIPMEPPEDPDPPPVPDPDPNPPGSGGLWTSSAGEDSLSFDPILFTEGTASLAVGGDWYRIVDSPTFRTADWFVVGTTLAIDVYIPSGQPNPYWLGTLDMFASVPSQEINDVHLGHFELGELVLDEWNTVEFALTDEVRTALLGDYAGGFVSIAVNTAAGSPPILLDNIRMGGDVADRTVFHQGPLEGGTSNALFSFENLADWTTDGGASLRQETELITGGAAALAVDAPGYTFISSRPFDTAMLSGVSETLSVDLYVPADQPNPSWLGAAQAYLSCEASGFSNEYLGQVELTGAFLNEFNTLTFPLLPVHVVSALQTTGQACSVALALNVNNGSGEWILDNLAFR